MSEELNNPETQEVTQVPKQAPLEEAPLEQSRLEQPVEQNEKEEIQAKNFRELRNESKQFKRERDEAVNLAKQLQQHAAQEQELRLNPDDLVEGKHFSKLQKEVTNLKDQLKDNEVKSSELAIESRLKSQYSDFDKVVNNDSVALLREHYPELAQTINSSTDLYSKAVTAYTLIKKLGLLPDPELQQEQALAQKNLSKPHSLASISPQQGNSPLSRANAFEHGLTDELKEQLRKEMFDARKGY